MPPAWAILPDLLTLAAMLAGAGLLAAALAVGLMAWGLLRPPRMSDGKAAWVLRRLSPGDLGLTYEDLRFIVRDERSGQPLRLAAWWIPARRPTGDCIILLHGYADAKVGAIAWAPCLHELGWNILALDLRAHGQSEGRDISSGYWERHDVAQAINQLRAQRPSEAARIVVAGLSYGATVAACVAAMGEDLAGLILDSPAADFQWAASAQMDYLGAPGRVFQRLSLRLAAWLAQADFSACRVLDVVGQIRCPLMVIAPERDPFVTPAQVEELRRAVESRPPQQGPSIFWRVPETWHLMALSGSPDEYTRRVGEFLAALGPSTATSESR